MLGFEKLALEVLVFTVATVWVMGLTYAFWRLFEKYTVQPLRHRTTIGGQRLGRRFPVAVRHGGLVHQDERNNVVISRRAR
jgi:hypothetical protein